MPAHRMRYEPFLEAVRERLPTLEGDRAREAVARTVYGLLPWLPPAERAALAEALPGPFRPADVEDVPSVRGDAEQFLRFVADRERYPPEQARYEVQAVLSALADLDPELGRRLRAALSDGFGELFQAPGGGPRAAAGVPPSPGPAGHRWPLRSSAGMGREQPADLRRLTRVLDAATEPGRDGREQQLALMAVANPVAAVDSRYGARPGVAGVPWPWAAAYSSDES